VQLVEHAQAPQIEHDEAMLPNDGDESQLLLTLAGGNIAVHDDDT